MIFALFHLLERKTERQAYRETDRETEKEREREREREGFVQAKCHSITAQWRDHVIDKRDDVIGRSRKISLAHVRPETTHHTPHHSPIHSA